MSDTNKTIVVNDINDDDFVVSYTPGSENYFENFCGSCDNFMSLDCPFMSYVTHRTRWQNIGCKNFWN